MLEENVQNKCGVCGSETNETRELGPIRWRRCFRCGGWSASYESKRIARKAKGSEGGPFAHTPPGRPVSSRC